MQQPGVRLLVGLAAAILLILVLTFVIRGCRHDRLVNSYKSYVTQASSITGDSKNQGTQLITILTNNARETPAVVKSKLTKLAQDSEDLAARAKRTLKPPDKLRDENTSLVSALTYRALGLRGLANKIQAISTGSRDPNRAASDLAEQMKFFLSSDFIYKQSWAAPTQQALKSEKISGVEVPETDLFLSKADYVAPSVVKEELLPGLQRSSTKPSSGTKTGTGNAHGTGILKVVALPSNKQLIPGTPADVAATDLKWQVSVQNQGDFSEKDIKVRVTYTPTGGDPQTEETTIPTIDSKQTLDVQVAAPTSPQFGTSASLLVEVPGLPEEKFLPNNRYEYSVTINLQ